MRIIAGAFEFRQQVRRTVTWTATRTRPETAWSQIETSHNGPQNG